MRRTWPAGCAKIGPAHIIAALAIVESNSRRLMLALRPTPRRGRQLITSLLWERPCASQQNVARDFRFGSKADIAVRPIDVRFAPESRHQLSALGCPLCAKSGHSALR